MIWLTVYRFYINHILITFRFSCVPNKIKLCELYNTLDEEDLNIANYVIDHGEAWPGTWVLFNVHISKDDI